MFLNVLSSILMVFSIISGIIFWIVLIYVLYKLFLEKEDQISSEMESFARKYNFVFYPKIDISTKEKSADLLTKGSMRTIYNYMVGKYMNWNVEIYNYSQAWKSYSYEYIVLEIEIRPVLPNFIITSHQNYLVESNLFLPISLLNLMTAKEFKFETEANEFNNFFKIFLERKRTDETTKRILSFLTPDIMAHLISENQRDPAKNINLEVRNNKIFLYKRILTKNLGILGRLSAGKQLILEEDIKRLLDLAIELAEEAEG